MTTAREAEEILNEEKLIRANVRWNPDPPGSGRYKLSVMVLGVVSRRLLELRGNVGRTNRSFALLYQGNPVRKYTVHAKHSNPDGQIVRGPHKHRWDDLDGDRWAYIPEDIAAGDVNREFMDFLRECHIELEGSYSPQSFL